MKICTCRKCRYIFTAPVIPSRCPDCGGKDILKASGHEVEQYRRFREIIREEIRMGLIPG